MTRIREKSAVVVFALLALMGLALVGCYLVAGHSWNKAATIIDDSLGGMEGYTVILFEGSIDPAEADDLAAANIARQKAEEDGWEPDVQTAADEDAVSGGDAASDGGAVPGEGDSGAFVPQIHYDASDLDFDMASPVAISDVVAEYCDKGASVVVLGKDDIASYGLGTSFVRGEGIFGVLGVATLLPADQLAESVAAFSAQDADFVVGVCADDALLESTEGIDILLSFDPLRFGIPNDLARGTYHVAPVEQGSVGVVFVSPSGVVSSKVIDEL